VALVIGIFTIITTANTVTICTVFTMVMWLCRDVSGESGEKLLYVTLFGKYRRTVQKITRLMSCYSGKNGNRVGVCYHCLAGSFGFYTYSERGGV
jgi:hypothetical protein